MVGGVALLTLGIVIIVITLLARMYQKYQKVVRTTPDVDRTTPNVSYGVQTSMPERASFNFSMASTPNLVRTTPNVSYGVQTSMPERASFDPADPLYESIRGGHYEIAMSSMEYYVNDGLGPND